MKTNDTYAIACKLFIECTPSKLNTIKVIEAMLKGYSLQDLITHRVAPNLSVSTLQGMYYRYREQVNAYANK